MWLDGCFHGLFSVIVLLRDLLTKVAEDFAAMGGQESGVSGGFST